MKIWSEKVSVAFRSFGIAIALASGATAVQPVLAGGDSSCHFHGNKPAAEATVLSCAEMHKQRLMKKGTIAANWEGVKHDSIQQVEGKGGKKEWKVMFKDASAKDKSKETLYMFFSISGNFIASNFTGN